MTAERITGRLLEIGQIITRDLSGEVCTYPMAMLITFGTREDLLAALAAKHVAFTFCEAASTAEARQ